jgi:hypothetical protein
MEGGGGGRGGGGGGGRGRAGRAAGVDASACAFACGCAFATPVLNPYTRVCVCLRVCAGSTRTPPCSRWCWDARAVHHPRVVRRARLVATGCCRSARWSATSPSRPPPRPPCCATRRWSRCVSAVGGGLVVWHRANHPIAARSPRVWARDPLPVQPHPPAPLLVLQLRDGFCGGAQPDAGGQSVSGWVGGRGGGACCQPAGAMGDNTGAWDLAATSFPPPPRPPPPPSTQNWCWQPDTLALLSGHVDDANRRLPREEGAKLHATKVAHAGALCGAAASHHAS